jgi:hypothetical protein
LTVAGPAIVEVPHDLDGGLGIRAAVDLVHRERLAGDVALEASVGPETGLAGEAPRGLLILRRRGVIALEGTDLEAHPLIEEEVPVVPELRRQIGPQRHDLLETDQVALPRARSRTARILPRGGPERSRPQAQHEEPDQ